jgi:hypothetical protein
MTGTTDSLLKAPKNYRLTGAVDTQYYSAKRSDFDKASGNAVVMRFLLCENRSKIFG